jgi:RNA polymerase sigma-70 factor (ECF subfamily)
VLRLKSEEEPTDEEAMVRFQQGDAGAFDRLLLRHSPGVLRFIMKMIRVQHAQAEDLLQEVFLKVIEGRKKYNSSRKFTTWLYTIARNHCIDYLRIEEHRRHASLDAPLSDEENDNPVILDVVRSVERNQEEKAIDKETQALLNTAIMGLREEYKEVFLLREIEELSLNEIAEIAGVPLSTVKSRLRYAYRDLREIFIKAGHFDKEQRVKEV